MKELESIYFKNKELLRDWLKVNYDTNPGIWIIIYKKLYKTECVTHSEALDEALCFGWIDSIIKKLDKERYVIKFSPRNDISNWSEINKSKVYKLISSGQMTEAGLKKIKSYLLTGKVFWEEVVKVEDGDDKADIFEIPDRITGIFSRNEPALSNFNKLSEACKRQYIRWISQAKKSETIQKRIDESIFMLKDNKKLGLK